MGIAFSFLPFFDACHKRGVFHSPLLALGSITLHESVEAITSLAREHHYVTLEREQSVRALMQDRYGLEDYADCDLNGLADMKVDLGQPLERNLKGRFGIILNAGTIEHVFDIRQAMANVHDLTRVGGSMVHLAPVTWTNHAFINFDPRMFRAIAEANRYTMLVEAFHVPQSAGSSDRRESDVIFVNNTVTDQAATTETELFAGPYVAANILYMVAMQKNSDVVFKIPYDVTI